MHCISVYITKEQIPNLPYAIHNDAFIYPDEFILPFDIPKIDMVYASTDYFGGSGEQSADIIIDGALMESIEDSDGGINKALEILGFRNNNPKEYDDLFEWVGLHHFRNNKELIQMIVDSLKIEIFNLSAISRTIDELGHIMTLESQIKQLESMQQKYL